MLTKQDLDQIKEIVASEVKKNSINLADREDLETLREEIREEIEKRISHLPTKDEFYEMMDKIMKELKAIREEHTVESYRVRNHEERITRLEKRVFAS